MKTSSSARNTRFILLMATAGLLHAGASAWATVTVASAGKAAAGVAITSGVVTVTVTEQVTTPAGLPVSAPTGAPTFTLDLYDDDSLLTGFDDCVGVDVTQATAGVTTTGWMQTGPSRGGLVNTISDWSYVWTVPTFTNGTPAVPCNDGILGAGTPRLAGTVAAGTSAAPAGSAFTWPPFGGSADIGTPGVPQIALADIGVTGPSRLADSSVLLGQQIAAFSRGYDEISSLASSPINNGVALYFATDSGSQSVDPDFDYNTPGLAFVLNSEGRPWYEQAYGADVAPGIFLGELNFLNVNTAASGALAPSSDMYFVSDGSDEIRYTPISVLASSSTYADLNTSAPVTGLAIEDVGLRGVFDSGDSILYSLDGSSAIFKLVFGGTPGFLTANGVTFDGSTSLDFSWIADSSGNTTITVGDITALSVASLNGSQITPFDRIRVDFREGIPEPGSFLLIAIGGAFLIFARKRST